MPCDGDYGKEAASHRQRSGDQAAAPGETRINSVKIHRIPSVCRLLLARGYSLSGDEPGVHKCYRIERWVHEGWVSSWRWVRCTWRPVAWALTHALDALLSGSG